MKVEDHEKVHELFQEAAGLAPEARSGFLDKACATREVRQEVDRLIENEISPIPEDPPSEPAPTFRGREGSPGSEPHLKPDSIVGHYRISRLIGRGGIGEVYLATDNVLGRNVAIKILKEEFSQDSEKLKRFIQEAKAASSLNNPNILTVYEIGESGGLNYIASELVEGRDLDEYVAEEQCSVEEILELAIQIVSALAAAHTHEPQITHRDIKPENIKVTGDGLVKILDFGLAKLSEGFVKGKLNPESETIEKIDTVSGTIMGTPSYMSPEQARGMPTDFRSDIFSFGIVLYELLTGRRPFSGETLTDILMAVVDKEPRRISEFEPGIPPRLEKIVQTALNKQPDARYRSTSDLLEELKEVKNELDFKKILGRFRSREHTTDEAKGIPTKFFSGESPTLSIGSNRARDQVEKGVRSFPSLLADRRVSFLQLALVIIAAAAIVVPLWYFWESTRLGTTPLSGPLRTVELESWSSAPGELLTTASFSPDGKLIAFGSTKSGTVSIWSRSVSGGDSVQVTKDAYYNRFPIWSPSGDEIAFYSKRGDEFGIWRKSFLGGEQKLVKTVADAESRPRLWAKSGQIYYQGMHNLYAVNAETGEDKQVTFFPKKERPATEIQISHDESRIAYVIEEQGLWKIKLVQSEGDDIELFSAKEFIGDLTWHPNGSSVWFTKLDDGVHRVYELPIGEKLPTLISHAEVDLRLRDISPDGEKLLVNSARENSDIWKIDLGNGKESIVADGIESELWGEVSPSGDQIAYQSVKDLSKGNKLLEGSIVIKPLLSEPEPEKIVDKGYLPAWSPDGKHIAYLKQNGQSYEIWLVRSTGGEPRLLSANGVQNIEFTMAPYNRVHVRNQSWMPDGLSVLFPAIREKVCNLWRASVEGKTDVVVTNNQDPNLRLSSPVVLSDGSGFAFSTKTRKRDDDGQHTYQVAFQSLTSGNSKVLFESKAPIRILGFSESEDSVIFASWKVSETFTHTPDETDLLSVEISSGRVTEFRKVSKAYFYNIHLSPDGKSIVYAARSGEADSVWLMPLSGGAPRRLSSTEDPKLFFSDIQWSHDGRFVIYDRQTRFSLLSMLVREDQPKDD